MVPQKKIKINKKKIAAILDPFWATLFKSETFCFTTSESLKIWDIRFQEVGTERLLNGTSKSEQTNTHTDVHTNIST